MSIQVLRLTGFNLWKSTLLDDIEAQQNMRQGIMDNLVLADTAHNMKLSKRMEKFLRYCYNLDIPNARRYMRKTEEMELEILDYIMEGDNSSKLVFAETDQSGRPKDGSVAEAEWGLTQYADGIKLQKTYRERILRQAIWFSNSQ
jgi:hypothetical protein